MAYRVELTDEAREQFDDLPKHVQPHVYRRLLALGDNPRPPGVVYLKGQWKGLLRIRSGKYRIVYRVEDDMLLVVVIRIGDRKDVYER